MAVIGFDTSNYTTSVAVWDAGQMIESRKLLPVPEGSLGLRQSDAVFAHVKALAGLVRELHCKGIKIEAVGASVRPREQEGSYMPCFMVGQMVGELLAELLDVPFFPLAHQSGHIAAALVGAGRLDLVEKKFISLHISGGTTECVRVDNLLEGRCSILSETLDLNAGQLIDRIGKMLGLSFPAGKALDALALSSTQRFKIKPTFKAGNPCISGGENMAKKMLAEGCPPEDVALFGVSFVMAVVERMAKEAVESEKLKQVLFAGGVMSNTTIREGLGQREGYLFAPPQYAADNAIGIAVLTGIKWGGMAY